MLTGTIRRRQTSKSSVKIGKYTLLDKIGLGGFGIVRKALNEQDGSLVAIKILDKAELQLQEMTQHAKREIALLTRIQHPNIVKGYEVLSSKTKLFLVMEYVEGGDLHSALSSKGKLPEQEAQKLFSSLIACLDYCHGQGIYHRDLKLENILLTSSGQLKICDFGLASVKAGGGGANELCQTLVGTEDFCPPEVLRNVPYNGDKADMWGAGVLLFTMLSGFYPFHGRDAKELREKIMNCRFVFPPDFPEAPKTIVNQLLVQRGNDRPSAANLLNCEWVIGKVAEHNRAKISTQAKKGPEDTTRILLGEKGRLRSTKDPVENRIEKNPCSWCDSDKFSTSLDDRMEHDLLCSAKRPGRLVYNALGSAHILNFGRLLNAMQDKSWGVQVQNRRWRWKVYENCFVGTDAVSWLTGHASCSREAATALGQKLLDVGAFYHVCREHGFKDDVLFYRWVDSEPGTALCMNLRKYWPRSLFPADPISVSAKLLQQLSHMCRAYQDPNDYQLVDTILLRRDIHFLSFLDAVTELQMLNLSSLTVPEERIGFLVNIYNLMWLQARIHVGNDKEKDFAFLREKIISLEYVIGGMTLSLRDIDVLLFGSHGHQRFATDHRNYSIGSNRSGPGDRVMAIGGSFGGLKMMHLWRSSDDKFGKSVLDPGRVEPLVFFLTSEGSAESPVIRAISAKEISVHHLMEVAAEYLNVVLEVDVKHCIVSYPPRIARFRAMISCADDDSFLEVLIHLCGGQVVSEGLREVQRKNQEDHIPLQIKAKDVDKLPYQLSSLAPRLSPNHIIH